MPICRVLKRVKDVHNVPVVTDIHETHQAAEAASVVDIFQIPAFLCRQTDLITAAARTGRIVEIKKGQMCSATMLLNSAEKVRSAGTIQKSLQTISLYLKSVPDACLARRQHGMLSPVSDLYFPR